MPTGAHTYRQMAIILIEGNIIERHNDELVFNVVLYNLRSGQICGVVSRTCACLDASTWRQSSMIASNQDPVRLRKLSGDTGATL